MSAAKEIEGCVSPTTAGTEQTKKITPFGDITYKCGSKDPTPGTTPKDGDSAVYMKVVSSIIGAATVMHLV